MAGTFAKKLLGDDKVSAVLKRLDGLTTDELWAGVAQTMKMVDNLRGDMKEDIKGMQNPSFTSRGVLLSAPSRRQGVDAEHPTGFRYVSRPSNRHFRCSLTILDTLHRPENTTNKAERLSFYNSTFFSPRQKVPFRHSVSKGCPTLALSSKPFVEP
jgi:hypothetical protein